MITYGWIAAGGALGTVARFALQTTVQNALQPWLGPAPGFPAGTFTVNVVGCFVIGLLSTLLAHFPIRDEYRMALIVGVLGGFTTFSSFSFETMQLAAARQLPLAAANLFFSCACGLGAVWCGQRVGQWYT